MHSLELGDSSADSSDNLILKDEKSKDMNKWYLGLLELGDSSSNSSDDACKLVARNAWVVGPSLDNGLTVRVVNLIFWLVSLILE